MCEAVLERFPTRLVAERWERDQRFALYQLEPGPER